jgi:hypothetical protein
MSPMFLSQIAYPNIAGLGSFLLDGPDRPLGYKIIMPEEAGVQRVVIRTWRFNGTPCIKPSIPLSSECET